MAVDTREDDDDFLTFAEECEPDSDSSHLVWRILIVDDEPDIHKATLLALNGVLIEGRQLEFVHAYSAVEARTALAENKDLAVVLLDVVMESDDAGLHLVRYIRDDLANSTLRIILRTGQPGYAPEIDTIRGYDINDYKAKSELTRVRLFTSLTTSIRSYWQVNQLEANRRGLELIVAAGAELSRPRGLRHFAEGVVSQLCVLLGISEEGLVCAAADTSGASPYVLAAAGRFSDWIGQPLQKISDERVREELNNSLAQRHHTFGQTTCLYFNVPGDLSIAAYVDVSHPLSDLDRNLIEVFCGNISTAFENTQLLQRISALAYEDQLVNLPNRNSFLARIDQRPAERDMLAVVDVDGFADINSILDQEFGDSVLIAVANRLRQSFSQNVVVARIGSDVFGLLGPQAELNEHLIDAVFSTPFDVGHECFRLSATSGLVQLGHSETKAVELLKNASVALKQAKHFNRGKAVYFVTEHAIAARERMQMLSSLRLAFSADRLYLVYQPFVDLASGRIIGAEALIRWRNNENAFVPPDRFIPLAEQSGLMVPIGDWITRSALQFLKRLQDLGHQNFRMAINVSHTQFREPDFVEKLRQAIAEYQVNTANLELELTESVAIDNIELIDRKLSAVRAEGIAVAIDDFGTGYSSLNIIRQLNVDRLKIDRAFVSGEECQDGDYSIAEMVLKLAEQLGLKTIAEGIETPEQYEKLRNLGCHDGQGFLFSEPLTPEEFEAFLTKQQMRVAIPPTSAG